MLELKKGDTLALLFSNAFPYFYIGRFPIEYQRAIGFLVGCPVAAARIVADALKFENKLTINYWLIFLIERLFSCLKFLLGCLFSFFAIQLNSYSSFTILLKCNYSVQYCRRSNAVVHYHCLLPLLLLVVPPITNFEFTFFIF